jgi:hypothetical protein
MDEVMVKALAPSPSNRYPDTKAFLVALGAVSLVPAAEVRPAAVGVRCPRCGADKQTGRFCRKCGARLPQQAAVPPPSARVERSLMDRPIQVTKVEVGRVDVGKGVEMTETIIAQPMPILAGDLEVEFPAPLEMPKLDMQGLGSSSAYQLMLTMPEPPAMPVIDWGEIAPPMPEVPTLESVTSREEGG